MTMWCIRCALDNARADEAENWNSRWIYDGPGCSTAITIWNGQALCGGHALDVLRAERANS